MINSVLTSPYAIDLGNGYTKRTMGKEVKIEPSVIGARPDYFSFDSDLDVISLNDDEFYYLGNDVFEAGVSPISAIGDDDQERYYSDEFKNLLIGSIAKDIKKSITIPLLVTGLPVNHFKSQAKPLINTYVGEHILNINDEQMIIQIQDIKVIPQPLGTYMYVAKNNRIDPAYDSTLVIDGGHGTIDVTEMKGKSIIRRAGIDRGVKSAYVEIYNYLIDEFGDTRGLTLNNVPRILEKGIKIDRQHVNVVSMPSIIKLLSRHFEESFRFIRDNQFDLKSYDNVIWTGGMALIYADLIHAKERNNFIVLDEALEANCLGYFEYGMENFNHTLSIQQNERSSIIQEKRC